jgi:dTDP-4-dehydrorhamnose 3,5-epimerase-like enzyme
MLGHKIIQLPKIIDPRGNLTFLEGHNHIPFSIARTFWIYDVPGGETRGGHAYKSTQEFIIALSGSFDILLHDGQNEMSYNLNRSYYGLYIPAGTWRHMENFSTNALALVVASTSFSELDYIRDFSKFKTAEKPTILQKEPPASAEKEEDISFEESTIWNCVKIDLPVNHREKGNITVIENGKTFPFSTRRVYYLYDVPGGETRGGHAHKKLHQLIIAAGGSFDVVLNDGSSQKTVTLNRPYQALKIVPGIWRELNNFSSGATCLVLASDTFSEQDYIRDFKEFLTIKNEI